MSPGQAPRRATGRFKRRAVFLDRDGVLNAAVVIDGKPYPPSDPSVLEILPGVADTLAAFRAAGFLNIVVTNQPDVASGKTSPEIVDAIHARLAAALELDEIRVCFDTCSPCYKPGPQMLLDAAAVHDIEIRHSFMIGDRWRDVDAGHNAGCITILIDRGYVGDRKPDHAPHYIVHDIAEAGRIVLEVSTLTHST